MRVVTIALLINGNHFRGMIIRHSTLNLIARCDNAQDNDVIICKYSEYCVRHVMSWVSENVNDKITII